MLQLPAHVGLPDPRPTVLRMVEVATRHPQMKLVNPEAVAAAKTLHATLWLSPRGASGIRPLVLDVEGIPWQTVHLV